MIVHAGAVGRCRWRRRRSPTAPWRSTATARRRRRRARDAAPSSATSSSIAACSCPARQRPPAPRALARAACRAATAWCLGAAPRCATRSADHDRRRSARAAAKAMAARGTVAVADITNDGGAAPLFADAGIEARVLRRAHRACAASRRAARAGHAQTAARDLHLRRGRAAHARGARRRPHRVDPRRGRSGRGGLARRRRRARSPSCSPSATRCRDGAAAACGRSPGSTRSASSAPGTLLVHLTVADADSLASAPPATARSPSCARARTCTSAAGCRPSARIRAAGLRAALGTDSLASSPVARRARRAAGAGARRRRARLAAARRDARRRARARLAAPRRARARHAPGPHRARRRSHARSPTRSPGSHTKAPTRRSRRLALSRARDRIMTTLASVGALRAPGRAAAHRLRAAVRARRRGARLRVRARRRFALARLVAHRRRRRRRAHRRDGASTASSIAASTPPTRAPPSASCRAARSRPPARVALTLAAAARVRRRRRAARPLAARCSSPLALAILLGYSLAKRFTWATHLWLGVALGGAPAGAWIAVTGGFGWAPLALSLAVACWVAGFDIIYASQDVALRSRARPRLDPGALRRRRRAPSSRALLHVGCRRRPDRASACCCTSASSTSPASPSSPPRSSTSTHRLAHRSVARRPRLLQPQRLGQPRSSPPARSWRRSVIVPSSSARRRSRRRGCAPSRRRCPRRRQPRRVAASTARTRRLAARGCAPARSPLRRRRVGAAPLRAIRRRAPPPRAARSSVDTPLGPLSVGGDALVLAFGPCSVDERRRSSRTAEAARDGRRAPAPRRRVQAAHLAVCVSGPRRRRPAAAPPRRRRVRPRGGQRSDRRSLARAASPSTASWCSSARARWRSTPLLKAAARCGRPLLLKRGFGATVDEWLLAAEYLLDGGAPGVILCERGIRTFEPGTRATLDLGGLALARLRTGLPILADPSHAAGTRALVAPLARAAVAAGADGLIVECHPEPGRARSDGPQALAPDDARRAGSRVAAARRARPPGAEVAVMLDAHARPQTTNPSRGAPRRRGDRRPDGVLGLQSGHGPPVGDPVPCRPSRSPRPSSAIGSQLSTGAVSMALSDLQKWGVVKKAWRPASGATSTSPRPASGRWCRACSASASWRSCARPSTRSSRAQAGRPSCAPAADADDKKRIKFIEGRLESLLTLSRIGEGLLDDAVRRASRSIRSR